MRVLYDRVAAIDVHKDMIKVAVRVPGKKRGTRTADVLEYRTFYGVLQAMARELRGRGVTHVVMEASGVYTQPVWAALWRIQVRLGMIPRTMVLVQVTGPGTHFRVTLSRAQQIFAGAYASVFGLARAVRGPAMRDERGLVCIDGTVVADGRKVFVLRYLQALDPDLACTPFFAAFSADAAWLTELRPAPGTRFPGASGTAETG